jgi:tetratricopeptide (TPR) repeat protein
MLALLAAALMSGASAARAQTSEASRSFDAGQQAFAAGDLRAALAAFEAAAAQGLAGPAVHYNIGVTAYRLGRLDRAQSAFVEVARTPAMASLAYYNLGLVALQRGDRDDALTWFERARAAPGDARVAALATAQLEALQETLSAPPRWSLYARLGGGHDDNVTLVRDDVTAPASGAEDEFLEAQLAASWPLDRSWRLDAAAALVDYQDIDTYDQSGASLAASRLWQASGWQGEAGIQASYFTLDGEGYEQSESLLLLALRPLTADARLRLRYRGSGVDGLGDFAGLEGQRHELFAGVDLRREPLVYAASYRYEDNDTDDTTFAYSWHQLAVALRWSPRGARWSAALEGAQRRARYENRGGQGSSDEDRTTVGVWGDWRIGAATWLVARYEYQNNAADDAAYDYDRNRVSIGIEYAR